MGSTQAVGIVGRHPWHGAPPFMSEYCSVITHVRASGKAYSPLVQVLEEQVEVLHSVEKIPIKEQKYDEERMFYIMKLSKHLPEGTKLDLVMLFTGRIQNGEETDAIGFYTSPDDAGGLVTEFVYCLNYQKDTLPVGLTMP